jgi:hypothetical protein
VSVTTAEMHPETSSVVGSRRATSSDLLFFVYLFNDAVNSSDYILFFVVYLTMLSEAQTTLKFLLVVYLTTLPVARNTELQHSTTGKFMNNEFERMWEKNVRCLI